MTATGDVITVDPHPQAVLGELLPIAHSSHRHPGDDGRWHVQFHWAVVDNIPTCVGVTVWGNVAPLDHNLVRELPDGAQAVTASALREIPLGAMTEQSRATLQHWFVDQVRDLDESADPFVEAWADRHRMRRGGYGANHLPNVAAYYTERMRLGDRAPRKAVAAKWNVSASAAAKWIERCRAAGLLKPAPGRGKPGGVRHVVTTPTTTTESTIKEIRHV